MTSVFLENIWPHLVGGLTFLITVITSTHVILYKKNARSAFAWIGIIWLVPVVGTLLYIIFGINRIKRKAKILRSALAEFPRTSSFINNIPSDEKAIFEDQFRRLSEMLEQIVEAPLLPGNKIIPLENGDHAYPEMLKAIEKAEETVTLSTYIFDNDRAGEMFLEALNSASKRGVDIRIIIDDVGARYSFPPITKRLKQMGIKAVRFLPTLLPTRLPFMNLRNHRKILVVDGRTGFTGGMNIREGHILNINPPYPVKDIHFLVKGPVVKQMQQVFAEDWYFCTGEVIEGEKWFPDIDSEGDVWARGIPDGPDEDFEKHLLTVQSALTIATNSVKIVTPYFLPEETLISTINLAALRGVKIDIVMPQENNIPIIKWASFNIMDQIMNENCRIWLTPPPFDHSKIMIVDDKWVLIGSGNWDARSFRLNFEFNIECYNSSLAREISEIVDKKISDAQRVTSEDIKNRSFPTKIRDGVAFIFSPYL